MSMQLVQQKHAGGESAEGVSVEKMMSEELKELQKALDGERQMKSLLME